MSTPADVSTLADLPEDVRDWLLNGDPEAATQFFPPLSDRDLEKLRQSVEARGIRVPVELDPDGRILDGHHRLKVAADLELEAGEIPVTVRDDLQGEEDVLEYVLEVNLGRRHLTREGRRTIVAELRGRGWSYPRIADRLAISVGTAHGDVQAFNSENLSDGDDLPDEVEGRDGKRYPATRDPSPSGGDGSGDRRRLPGHAQGRSGGSPSASRNRSGRGRRHQERDSSTATEDEDRPEPDRDPRLELLDRADRLLTKARQRTPEEEAGVREELEVLADRVNALQRRIAGTGDVWRPS